MNQHEVALASGNSISIPWGVIAFVTLIFFVNDHDFAAQTKFQQLSGAIPGDSFSERLEIQSPLRKYAAISILGAFGAVSLLRRPRNTNASLSFFSGMMLVLFGWMLLSVCWSEDVGLTARRLVVMALLACGAGAVATRLSPRDMVRLVLFLSTTYLIIGLGVELAQGSFRPFSGAYRFAGTLHPNHQGVNCSLLLIASLASARLAPEKRWRFLLMACAALLFLYLSKSRTAMGGAGAALLIQWGFSLRGAGRVVLIALGLACLCLFGLLGDVLSPALREGLQLGRGDDSSGLGTLTGRTPMWQQCLEYGMEKPLLGHGYGAFWNVEHVRVISKTQGWPIFGAHNAYIDLFLELGLFGLLLFMLVLLAGYALSLAAHSRTNNAAYAFLGTVMLFAVFNGLLESILAQRSLLIFLLLAAFLHLGTQALDCGGIVATRPSESALRPRRGRANRAGRTNTTEDTAP